MRITYPRTRPMKCAAGPKRNFGYDPVQHRGSGAQSDPWDAGGAGLRLRVQLAAGVSSTLTGRAPMCGLVGHSQYE